MDISIDGGTPTPLWNRFAASPRLSFDGKSLAFSSRDDQGRPVYVFCDLPDCSSPQMVPPPESGIGGPPVGRQFLANRGIPYVTGSPANVWVRMLDGKAKPQQITNFTDDRQILDVARATQTRDIVLIKGLKKQSLEVL